MKLEFSDKNAFSLPSGELLRALDEAGETDLKVLLFLAANAGGGVIDTDESKQKVIDSLQISESDYDFAIAFWRGAKVMRLVRCKRNTAKKISENKENALSETSAENSEKTLLPDTLPDYTQLDMAKKLEGSAELKATIDECQQIVGKIFSPADVSVIVGMSDRLGLAGEYITMLVAYCVGTGKKSLRYIEKTACSMYDEGIDTPTALADYITKRENQHETAAVIRRMTGTDGRELTAKEEKLLKKWLDEYSYDADIVRIAFELTVPQVSKSGSYLPYMGKILDNWFERRLKTADEVRAYLDSKKQGAQASADKGFDADDFFKKALEKNRRSDGVKNYASQGS